MIVKIRLLSSGFALFLCVAMQFTSTSTKAASLESVTPVDVKTDDGFLLGKRVVMSGWMFQFNDHYLLSQTVDGGGSIYVDVHSLPRSDRKKLLIDCSERRCQTNLLGVVRRVDFGELGLTADTIKFGTP